LKPILALVISFLIFAGFHYLVDIELLDYVQTRFYNPSVVRSYVRENSVNAELVHDHIVELQTRFMETLSEPAVRSSFLHTQSAEDIFERSRIFGILLESVGGLQSVQFVDSGGTRIHFSTSARDIINQNRDSTSFRNYGEDPAALPFDAVSVPDGGSAKYTMDGQGERIIFSFPFHDSMDVYRGTALFNISVRSLAEKLIAQGRIKVSDDISVISRPAGILLGCPESSKSDIYEKVAGIWNEGILDRVILDSADSGVNYSLISYRTNHGIFFGRLINDYLFYISDHMKLILQLSMFLTTFLSLFFLINLKPNPLTIVRNRLKRLRDSLFNKLYVDKSSQERLKWILELEQRRDGIRTELKHNLKLNSRLEKNIDSMIDKSWDELLAVLKSGSDYVSPVSVEQKAKDTPAALKTKKQDKVRKLEKAEKLEEVGEVEELDEIGEAEELEEVGEVEELDEIEEAEELEEVGEVEELDEIEEAEELEEVGEVEELDEIEEAEELEEVGEIEELEEVGEVEELDEIEEAEELEEVGEIEELDEIEEAEELEEVGEIEELDEIEETEELEEVGEVEELEEVGEVEELDEIEEAKELEEAGEIEELDEIDKVDELEDVSEVRELDKIDEAEEFEEIRAIEELDEIREVEVIEEFDEIEEVGTAEELDEIVEVEAIDEVDELEEVGIVEELDEIAKTEELDEIDEVEKIEEAEEIDEIEEVIIAEELNEIEEIEPIAEELDETEEPEPNLIDIALREAMEEPVKKPGGLLGLANKLLSLRPRDTAPKGLLQKAGKKNIKTSRAKHGKGLLAAASESKDLQKKPVRKGLLAIASESKDLQGKPKKGLLAVASGIEAAQYTVTHDFIDLPPELDIVSPFSSMFDDLTGEDSTI